MLNPWELKRTKYSPQPEVSAAPVLGCLSGQLGQLLFSDCLSASNSALLLPCVMTLASVLLPTRLPVLLCPVRALGGDCKTEGREGAHSFLETVGSCEHHPNLPSLPVTATGTGYKFVQHKNSLLHPLLLLETPAPVAWRPFSEGWLPLSELRGLSIS